VTDLPFRRLVRESGASLTHTQMVSCAALVRSCSAKTMRIIDLGLDEDPVGIQLFGCDPAEMAESARMVDEHGADLISINFGCPVPKVVTHNGGSAMLKEPEKLESVVRAVVAATEKPVVPKIRIGWDSEHINAVDIGKRCEAAGAAGLVIHGRTRSQGYSGKANWDVIAAVKKAISIPVIGNCDLFSAEEIAEALEQSGVDGVMLGRGAMGKPWIFERGLRRLRGEEPGPEPLAPDKVRALLRHLRMSWEYKGQWGLAEMRKQSMWYLSGLPWAAETRNAINQTLEMPAIESILTAYLERLGSWVQEKRESPEFAEVG
jgi:tRNA-dihydrouridine synthase B